MLAYIWELAMACTAIGRHDSVDSVYEYEQKEKNWKKERKEICDGMTTQCSICMDVQKRLHPQELRFLTYYYTQYNVLRRTAKSKEIIDKTEQANTANATKVIYAHVDIFVTANNQKKIE